MKKIIIALLALVVMATPAANAQLFRWGIKAGVNVNSLHFNKEDAKADLLNSDNRAGFTGGLMAEINVPVIGICFDASLMYTHRVNNIQGSQDPAIKTYNNDYIEIPVNLKYRFSLPVVGSAVAPYIFTGPSFAILASKEAINDIRNKKCDISWNVGLGIQFFKHLQLSAGYGFGINKAATLVSSNYSGDKVTAKSNAWTVTAAWLF